jgi:hypothetical protein
MVENLLDSHVQGFAAERLTQCSRRWMLMDQLL